jgi:hypothetical protein
MRWKMATTKILGYLLVIFAVGMTDNQSWDAQAARALPTRNAAVAIERKPPVGTVLAPETSATRPSYGRAQASIWVGTLKAPS